MKTIQPYMLGLPFSQCVFLVELTFFPIEICFLDLVAVNVLIRLKLQESWGSLIRWIGLVDDWILAGLESTNG